MTSSTVPLTESRASAASVGGSRSSTLGAALLSGALLLGAALLSTTGRAGTVGGLFGLQCVLGLGWLALLGSRARPAGFALAGGCALAADLLLSRNHAEVTGALAGIVAVGLLLAVAWQLVWRSRVAVTAVLTSHVSAILVASAPSYLVAVRHAPNGRDSTLVALITVAAGPILGAALTYLGSALVRLLPVRFQENHVKLAFDAGVSWNRTAGPAGWLLAGAAVGAAFSGGDGAALGVAAAAAGALAAQATIGWACGETTLRTAPVRFLLPLSVSAPVAYGLSRVLFG